MLCYLYVAETGGIVHCNLNTKPWVDIPRSCRLAAVQLRTTTEAVHFLCITCLDISSAKSHRLQPAQFSVCA